MTTPGHMSKKVSSESSHGASDDKNQGYSVMSLKLGTPVPSLTSIAILDRGILWLTLQLGSTDKAWQLDHHLFGVQNNDTHFHHSCH